MRRYKLYEIKACREPSKGSDSVTWEFFGCGHSQYTLGKIIFFIFFEMLVI